MDDKKEKSSEELFMERINDFSGFQLDGIGDDEDKKKVIDELIKKRNEIIKEIKKL